MLMDRIEKTGGQKQNKRLQSGCNFNSRLQPLILRFGGSVATHSDKKGFPKGTPLAHDFACKV